MPLRLQGTYATYPSGNGCQTSLADHKFMCGNRVANYRFLSIRIIKTLDEYYKNPPMEQSRMAKDLAGVIVNSVGTQSPCRWQIAVIACACCSEAW